MSDAQLNRPHRQDSTKFVDDNRHAISNVVFRQADREPTHQCQLTVARFVLPRFSRSGVPERVVDFKCHLLGQPREVQAHEPSIGTLQVVLKLRGSNTPEADRFENAMFEV